MPSANLAGPSVGQQDGLGGELFIGGVSSRGAQDGY